MERTNSLTDRQWIIIAVIVLILAILYFNPGLLPWNDTPRMEPTHICATEYGTDLDTCFGPYDDYGLGG